MLTKNYELLQFIRRYVFGASNIFNYCENFQTNSTRSRSRFRSSASSRSRTRSRCRSRSRSRKRSQSLNRIKSKSRESLYNGGNDYNFPQLDDLQPVTINDPVEFLKEECLQIGSSVPQYSPPFSSGQGFVVYVNLGPITKEGYGATFELAKKRAAAAVVEALFRDV